MPTCKTTTKSLTCSGSLEAKFFWKEVLRLALPEHNCMAARLKEQHWCHGTLLVCSTLTWALVLPQVGQSELIAVNNRSLSAQWKSPVSSPNSHAEPGPRPIGVVACNGLVIEACSTYTKSLAFPESPNNWAPHWLAQGVTLDLEYKRCFSGSKQWPMLAGTVALGDAVWWAHMSLVAVFSVIPSLSPESTILCHGC